MSEVAYYINPEAKLMYKLTGPTHAYLLQVDGRDLSAVFHHRHESVTYPSAERLQQELAGLAPSTAEAWYDLMNEYLQVNKAKLEIVNEIRQRKYDKGELKL